MTKTPRASKKRFFHLLHDRRADIPDLTPESELVLNEKYRCSGKLCLYLSNWWHTHPEPIDLSIEWCPKSWSDRPGNLGLRMLNHSIVELLSPYCEGMHFGTVLGRDTKGGLQKTPFVTVAAPRTARIQSHRGRHCRHSHHSCCNVFINKIGWASEAIVERSLDDRLVYMDEQGDVLVDSELAERLELKTRFPKLWLYKVAVVPEPLDGEVLPCDPGWDGTFRPGPWPEPPETRLKKGRVTWD